MIIINNASYSNVSVTYTADGTQREFSFPFDYLRKAFVKVEVNEEIILVQGTDYTVSDNKTVVLTEAPESGTIVRVFRETSTTRLVSWADASVLRAKDMTIQQVQNLHILEEQQYWVTENAIIRQGKEWNARNFPIKNVGDPVDPKDATNKEYVDNNFMKLDDNGDYWVGRGKTIRDIEEPIRQSDGATKNYVDHVLAGLSITGDRVQTFNSVALMKEAPLEPGMVAMTTGYHNPNDGGAGVYNIRACGSGEPESCDNGSTISLTNGNIAELIHENTVNVKQFGAYGNGTTTDDTAFQNIATYASSKNLIMLVPPATYKVTATITGTFGTFGDVTITGGGTVNIVNLKDVADDAQDSADAAATSESNALSYRNAAQTSAAAAAASASEADTTATALTNFLETKETLTAPAVDPTLTISGAAADAKVTGELSKIYSDILTPDATFGTGGNLTPNNRFNFDRVNLRANSVVTLTDDDLALSIIIYNAVNTSIYSSGWLDGKRTINIPYDGSVYIQLSKGHNDHNSALDTTKADYYKSQVIIKSNKIDKTLSVSNAPADALMTGKSTSYKFPVLRNGSTGNVDNPNAVAFANVERIDFGRDTVDIEFIDDAVSVDSYAFTLHMFGGSVTDGMSTTTAMSSSSVTKISFNLGYKSAKHISFNVSDLVGYTHFAVSIMVKNGGTIVPLRITSNPSCLRYKFTDGHGQLTDNYCNNVIVPLLVNGTMPNEGNANAVSFYRILPIKNQYDYMTVEFIGDTSSTNKYLIYGYYFKNATDDMVAHQAYSDGSVGKKALGSSSIYLDNPVLKIAQSEWHGYDHFAINVLRYNGSTPVPIRTADEEYCIRVSYGYDTPNLSTQKEEISHKLNNAQHIPAGACTPLTLLHFSDLHADTNALGRIIGKSSELTPDISIDGKICTGDMVENTAGQISSWWDENVMTCIGNHDCATYDAVTGYDWTALSMADRDAYYIAPFESNWGITHTSGTSYYYKDYTTQKVRLIVMDVMLYMSADYSTEATAQTTWLENLLADAITNNLHVLIAIHAPHGGATAKECSFSKYGQGTMPTYGDCNTPQTIIDTVATKITAGLKFIGYLVGHTHQDNMWDAEGDGKQLMYCVTCAAVSYKPQWINSDQYRSNTEDAYNLVTIDTANTLVKIVRGGGADIDDHMRTRKAICFNYTTGEIVGEVL